VQSKSPPLVALGAIVLIWLSVSIPFVLYGLVGGSNAPLGIVTPHLFIGLIHALCLGYFMGSEIERKGKRDSA